MRAQYNYRAALADFDHWCATRRLALRSSQDWDTHLAAYMEFLFLRGEQPWLGRDTLYGAAWQHDLPIEGRSDFVVAKRTLKGWEKRCPGETGQPVPFDILLIISNYMMLQNGTVGIEAAAANLLAFDCYLRPSETVDLCKQHLTPPRANSTARWVVTVKPRDEDIPAKNREFDCSVEAGGPRRDFIQKLVNALHAAARPNGRLFPNLTLSLWEKLFRDSCAHFGYSKPKFTPRSLRHGGPSLDKFNRDLDDNDILRRGRWRSLDSVRRYGKTGVLAKILTTISEQDVNTARQLEHVLPSALSMRLGAQQLVGPLRVKRKTSPNLLPLSL